MRARVGTLLGVVIAAAGVFFLPWHSRRMPEVATAPTTAGTSEPSDQVEMSPPLYADGQGPTLDAAAILGRQVAEDLPPVPLAEKVATPSQKKLESHEAILGKLERFLEFPSAYNARVLQIESIIAIQEQKGAVMPPASNGQKAAPKGMASIHDDSRGVYFAPEEFPELRELRMLGDGERVPAALAAAIEVRAQEAIATLDH